MDPNPMRDRAVDNWWLQEHPMSHWIRKISNRVDMDISQIATIMEAAIGCGIRLNLPVPEDGFHITRYVMYRRISEFFKTGTRSGKVLEVSGDRGAIFHMFEPTQIEYTPTSFPEVDAEHMPFADNAFDFVICDQVIEHLARPKTAVNEMKRVLRHGGWLIVATACMEVIHTRPDNVSDYWRFTPQGLQELLAGFSNIYQCEGWGNREALAIVLFGGLQKYVPVSGHPYLERVASYNEPHCPLSVWAIVQK